MSPRVLTPTRSSQAPSPTLHFTPPTIGPRVRSAKWPPYYLPPPAKPHRGSSRRVSPPRNLWKGNGMTNAMASTMTFRSKAGIYVGAALLRLLLTVVFPGLPDLLTGRVEISTPVTSFKRCKCADRFHHPTQLVKLPNTNGLLLQYKRDCFFIITMCGRTMVVSTTKRRCSCRCSRCSLT